MRQFVFKVCDSKGKLTLRFSNSAEAGHEIMVYIG
jgi:hypothetical protein